MESNRCISKSYYCYTCEKNVKILVNMDYLQDSLKCPFCKGDFLEEVQTVPKKQVPTSPPHVYRRIPQEFGYSTTSHTHVINNNGQTTVIHQPGPTIITHGQGTNNQIPTHSTQIPSIQTNSQPINLNPIQPEPSVPNQSSPNRPHWHNTYFNHHGTNLMNNIGNMLGGFSMPNMFPNQNTQSPGFNDPFSPNFMNGFVFGNGLNIADFFSNSFMPNMMGVNFEDFGMNFNSNFMRFDPLISLIIHGNMEGDHTNPVDKDVYSKLPRFKLEEKHCKKNDKGEMEKPSCSICCDQMKLGDVTILLPCGHMFHDECIKPWLEQHNTCPLCRKEMPSANS